MQLGPETSILPAPARGGCGVTFFSEDFQVFWKHCVMFGNAFVAYKAYPQAHRAGHRAGGAVKTKRRAERPEDHAVLSKFRCTGSEDAAR